MAGDFIIKNARVWDGKWPKVQRDLYTASGRIVDKPAHGAQVVDLDGYTIFPGLVNAHDHLELNHYPRSKFREVYDNAHQWGEDMNARLDTEPYQSLRAYPLKDRLFIGGLKNLLCGATTVAHHGPPHRPMFARDFPVRVLKKYGWAHSLHFNTEQEIVESYRRTPKDWPWFIHLAEGTDEVATSEYGRLKALGCVGPNTVIVHGVGMTEEDIADAAPRVRGLVWCPSTNAYLLGKTARIDLWAEADGQWAFGSDSRLTADGDLMIESAPTDEVFDVIWDTVASKMVPILENIEAPLTHHAAALIGLRGSNLSVGSASDWFLIELDYFRRSATHLIVKGGVPQIGDPAIMAKFPHVQTVAATLDRVPKAIHIDLARRIHQSTLKEPGLEVDALPKGRFWLI
jgi:cytosine/adenosine deaminase-related metal-dependent hydrolase